MAHLLGAGSSLKADLEETLPSWAIDGGEGLDDFFCSPEVEDAVLRFLVTLGLGFRDGGAKAKLALFLPLVFKTSASALIGFGGEASVSEAPVTPDTRFDAFAPTSPPKREL